jgi:hypothetical protein
MATRQRDYRKEYARRVALAMSKLCSQTPSPIPLFVPIGDIAKAGVSNIPGTEAT